MSEDDIIRNCAPTLAGLKTANMFTCPFESKESLLDDLRQLNKRLGPKGLQVLPLRFSDSNALIYLYRPSMLRNDLSDAAAMRLLQERGYDPANYQRCVVKLVQKLRREEEFPHEIGLFLGYPPEDVFGFMEQGPDCCKASGCWKVYGDETAAQKKFAQYKKCTRVYRYLWAKGNDIERLTVAG